MSKDTFYGHGLSSSATPNAVVKKLLVISKGLNLLAKAFDLNSFQYDRVQDLAIDVESAANWICDEHGVDKDAHTKGKT